MKKIKNLKKTLKTKKFDLSRFFGLKTKTLKTIFSTPV